MEQTEQKDTWYYEHDEAEYIGGEGEISGGGGTVGHFIGRGEVGVGPRGRKGRLCGQG